MRTPEQIIGRDALAQLILEGYAVIPAAPQPQPVMDGAMTQWTAPSDTYRLPDSLKGSGR